MGSHEGLGACEKPNTRDQRQLLDGDKVLELAN